MSSTCTRSFVIRSSSPGHRRHGRDHARRRRETELGDEPGRPQHAQRVVGERLLGRGRGVERAGGQRGEPAVGVDEPPVAPYLATRELDRHRVDGEVAADQVVVDRLAEGDDRVAAHAVVGVGPERRDLDGRAVPAGADRPEGDPRVPHRLGPALQHGEHRGRMRVGGEVEVGLLAGQRVRLTRRRARCRRPGRAGGRRRRTGPRARRPRGGSGRGPPPHSPAHARARG